MGAPPKPALSYLDRLKALDALPDLVSQLQEAKQLCDHNARAEMILRWLMAKLKTSEDARKNDTSWDLLTSTVRLLPAQRIAVLLNGIVPILQQAWAAPDLPGATILAIARLFRILLELGQGTDGAAIRSLLSVGGGTAATMCGDWYRLVYHSFSKDAKVTSLVSEALLDPALQLWGLRKHMESDDTSFNNHCMVSILSLLTRLRKASISTSAKRKRGQHVAVSDITKGYQHALEALIARHTVLPARTVFHRKHEQQPRRMSPGQQKTAQPTISERLSTLKEVIATGASGDSVVDSLCLVLDIALRSVSTPTPRDRFAERPWVETLFASLRECVVGQNRMVINGTLLELLETIRRNGMGQTALSAQTLTSLMKTHAIAPGDSKESVDFQLVAKFAELDPDVLTNPTLTEQILGAISDSGDQQSSLMITLWRDGIILPSMTAYARGRSLVSFVDIWRQQLLRTRISKEPSVWEYLSTHFSDILENHLLAEQIFVQVDRFRQPVSAALENKSKITEEVASVLIANIVLLDAFLSGTRSDDLVLRLQDEFSALLHNLIDLANLKGFKTTVAKSCHYWSLLTRAFQLWFPLWATKQHGDAAVESEGMSILTSKAFKSALAECSASEIVQTSHYSARTARAAQRLVASLYICFQQYGAEQGCPGSCAEAIENIVKQGASASSVFIRQPALLSSLHSTARQELLSAPWLFTADAESGEHGVAAPIKALLASSRGTNKQQTTADAVSVILKQLHCEPGTKIIVDETILIPTLASFDPQSIDQTQRINILDTVSQLPVVATSQNGAAKLQTRFALLLKFLAVPCQNAQLLTDPTKLWTLAGLLDLDAKAGKAGDLSPIQLDSLDNVQLLEEIVRSVFGSWLTTQDREKSQKILVATSQLVKDAIKLGTKSGKLSARKGELAFIKVAITMSEDHARDDVKLLLVHRASKTVRSYLETLMAESLSISGVKGADMITSAQAKTTVSAIQALLDVPDELIALSGVDKADHAKRLYKLTRDITTPSRIHGDRILQSRLLAVCFQLICRNSPGKNNLTTLAEDILERDLTIKDVAAVLLAYEKAFKQADAEWKLAAINSLSKDSSLTGSSSLLLQQIVLKALTLEDAEAIPTTKDIVFHTIKAAAAPGIPPTVRRTALQSLDLVFKEKTFLITQYTIEQTLVALQELLSSNLSSEISALYLNICHVLTVVLAHHRSRLQGRFHLLIGNFQQLTSHLFSNGKAEVHQARSLAKLLESFCSPPALRYRKGGKPSELVDEAKKAQAHAGQFAQYLLHFYCSCVLTGSLGEGVREALLPGLWSMIEAMEAYNEDGVRVLSSAANNSERAVLRSLYEDWKKFGKWEGV